MIRDVSFPNNFSQTRLKPWYPGQLGIAGSDNSLGVRSRSRGIVLYVDTGHGNRSDNNDGTDPEAPKATIQSAVSSPFLTDHSMIVVMPGDYTETVTTRDYVVGPNYVTLVGVSHGIYSPDWASAGAAFPCLDLRAIGWRVEGFRFSGPVTEGCIQLRHTDTNANDIAIRTYIVRNLFDGKTVGRYGICTHGPYDVWIVENVFQLFNNAVAGGAIALWLQTSPLAIPYRNHVLGNVFWDNNNHVICPMNGSEVVGNRFQKTGIGYAAAQVLQTSLGGNPGTRNIVTGNYFEGDYSVAGGYTAGAADSWGGNISDDLAEAEVGDNGLTVALPS